MKIRINNRGIAALTVTSLIIGGLGGYAIGHGTAPTEPTDLGVSLPITVTEELGYHPDQVTEPTGRTVLVEDLYLACDNDFRGEEWEECVGRVMTLVCDFEPFRLGDPGYSRSDERCGE